MQKKSKSLSHEPADKRKMLELTLEYLNDGLIIVDNNGTVKSINKSAQALTGWDKDCAEDMELKQVLRLHESDKIEKTGRLLLETINSEASVDIGEDTVLISKTGNEINVSGTFSNIFDENSNSSLGVAVLFRDVTKIRNMKNELEKEKEQAQAANMAKSSFLANMSHEIRTPINGIEGMIDLTLNTELTREQRENLLIAKECSNSLIEVINNILDLSKIEAGKMKLNCSVFSLRELTETLIKTNIVHAREKGILLSFEVFDGIYSGDSHKISQILNNLLSNAIKFTDHGRVYLTAEIIDEDESKALLKFSVEDTGIGISAQDMDKLFKSFSQIDDTYTRKYGGTGLGLVISKKLAELMGGEITAESIKGRGSIFSLTIMLDKQSNLLDTAETGEASSIPEHILSTPAKILIAEDNIPNQEVLKRMLRRKNYEVKVADNGDMVLNMLNAEKFDVVLMDIQMPVMDGVEVTRIIRENEKKTGEHLQIIALTAYAIKGDREKFLSLGMDDYISKPVIMTELYSCIEKAVSKGKDTTYRDAEFYLDTVIMHPTDDKKTSIEEVSALLNKLIDSVNDEDFKSCEDVSHALKKYSRYLKSPVMKNAAFRAELAARRKDTRFLKEQAEIIKEELSKIK